MQEDQCNRATGSTGRVARLNHIGHNVLLTNYVQQKLVKLLTVNCEA